MNVQPARLVDSRQGGKERPESSGDFDFCLRTAMYSILVTSEAQTHASESDAPVDLVILPE